MGTTLGEIAAVSKSRTWTSTEEPAVESGSELDSSARVAQLEDAVGLNPTCWRFETSRGYQVAGIAERERFGNVSVLR